MTRLKFDHFAASEKNTLLFKMEAILEWESRQIIQTNATRK